MTEYVLPYFPNSKKGDENMTNWQLGILMNLECGETWQDNQVFLSMLITISYQNTFATVMISLV